MRYVRMDTWNDFFGNLHNNKRVSSISGIKIKMNEIATRFEFMLVITKYKNKNELVWCLWTNEYLHK